MMVVSTVSSRGTTSLCFAVADRCLEPLPRWNTLRTMRLAMISAILPAATNAAPRATTAGTDGCRMAGSKLGRTEGRFSLTRSDNPHLRQKLSSISQTASHRPHTVESSEERGSFTVRYYNLLTIVLQLIISVGTCSYIADSLLYVVQDAEL